MNHWLRQLKPSRNYNNKYGKRNSNCRGQSFNVLICGSSTYSFVVWICFKMIMHRHLMLLVSFSVVVFFIVYTACLKPGICRIMSVITLTLLTPH